MNSESRCISCDVTVPIKHIKRSLCQHCRDEIRLFAKLLREQKARGEGVE